MKRSIPLVLAFWGNVAQAQTQTKERSPLWTEGSKGPTPTLDAQSFTRVMRAAGPAVVSIVATSGASPNPAETSTGRNVGAGFFIRKDGLLVTNQHVVADATSIAIRTHDGRSLDAEIVGWDRRTDLALLRVVPMIKGQTFPVVALDRSELLEIGEWVVAIGNPLALEQTLTAGIVSAKGRRDLPVEEFPYQDFIQTDASINPGNSGGPLLNLRGQVVGILTAVNRAGQGIGFATPIDRARPVLRKLYRDGRVRRSWMGVVIERGDLTEELARAFSLSDRNGALVSEVVAGSPAQQAGLEPGDVVVQFAGTRIKRASDLSWLVSLAEVDSEVELVAVRSGKPRSLRVKLLEMPGGEDPLPPSRQKTTIGMEVAERNGPPKAGTVDGGVTVTRVVGGSAADRAGVEVGDIVLEVNGKLVHSVDEYFHVLKEIPTGEVVRLRLRRQDGELHWAAFPKG